MTMNSGAIQYLPSELIFLIIFILALILSTILIIITYYLSKGETK